MLNLFFTATIYPVSIKNTFQARRILKTSHLEQLNGRVKLSIEKTLTAPQVQRLDEVTSRSQYSIWRFTVQQSGKNSKGFNLCVQSENDFWNRLIERYLKPLNDPKSHLDEVTRELKSLRNKVRQPPWFLRVT